jgi:DNA-binding NarL/FixJ family response regulator
MAKQERVIFLVDDDPMQLQMIKDYLDERFVMKLYQYATGEEALANMNLNPEIVILDYHLMSVNKSAENGVEILKKMKEACPTTSVIMLSGQDKISVAVECMKNGAYDYVVKSESAFTRIENIFNNIGEHMKTVHQLKIYKLGFRVLIAAIILIAILVFVAVEMGWATAHMGGFD